MSSTKTNTVISVLIFLMINSFIISLGDFYFFTFHAAADLGAKSIKHQDKQTTRQNYIFPVLCPDSGRRLRHGVCRDGTRHHPNFLYVMPLCMGLVIGDLGR